MKKIIILLGIVLLGVGGYFGYQRLAIHTALKLVLAECDPNVSNDPVEQEFKKKLCLIVEEENKQFKQTAASSKTVEEFKTKAEALIAQWAEENKIGKLIEQYRLRKQQK